MLINSSCGFMLVVVVDCRDSSLWWTSPPSFRRPLMHVSVSADGGRNGISTNATSTTLHANNSRHIDHGRGKINNYTSSVLRLSGFEAKRFKGYRASCALLFARHSYGRRCRCHCYRATTCCLHVSRVYIEHSVSPNWQNSQFVLCGAIAIQIARRQ